MTGRSATIRGGMLMAWLLAMGSPAGVAQQVYKCRDADGRSLYQATPCGSGKTQAWVRDMETAPAIPSPAPAATPRTSPATPRRPPGGTPRARAVSQGAVISMHRDARACARAKAQRERALALRGLKRTFLELRRWDDRVHEACR